MMHNWLTIPDAARHIEVPKRTVYRWVQDSLVLSRTSCGHTFVYVPHLYAQLDKRNARGTKCP